LPAEILSATGIERGSAVRHARHARIVEPELELVASRDEMPFHAGPSADRQRERGLLLAVGGHRRRGLEVRHELRAIALLDAETVDGVIAIVRRAALTLQQRPVHGRRARERLRRGVQPHHGPAEHRRYGARHRIAQVDGHIAATILRAARREHVQ
jgi:hypothetical protein